MRNEYRMQLHVEVWTILIFLVIGMFERDILGKVSRRKQGYAVLRRSNCSPTLEIFFPLPHSNLSHKFFPDRDTNWLPSLSTMTSPPTPNPTNGHVARPWPPNAQLRHVQLALGASPTSSSSRWPRRQLGCSLRGSRACTRQPVNPAALPTMPHSHPQ
jgi:hypothetical protein